MGRKVRQTIHEYDSKISQHRQGYAELIIPSLHSLAQPSVFLADPQYSYCFGRGLVLAPGWRKFHCGRFFLSLSNGEDRGLSEWNTHCYISGRAPFLSPSNKILFTEWVQCYFNYFWCFCPNSASSNHALS